MATVIPTSLDVVLLAIQARLIASLGWGAERVLITDPAVIDHLDYNHQADAYLMIWPDAEPIDVAVYEGADRIDARMHERFSVEVRTRTMLDTPQDETIWLTDATLGHIASARHPIWVALIGFNPVDSKQNALTIGPIAPSQGQRPRPDLKKNEWGRSTMTFEFWYELSLTPIVI